MSLSVGTVVEGLQRLGAHPRINAGWNRGPRPVLSVREVRVPLGSCSKGVGRLLVLHEWAVFSWYKQGGSRKVGSLGIKGNVALGEGGGTNQGIEEP